MILKLPPKVRYILDVLHRNGYEAFTVGGCVRDSVLARTPDDWDITTSARPEEIKSCFRRTVDTGIAHGTVTVMLEEDGFEVTTYRIDGVYSDGRHPDYVSFTPLLSEDLRRRDFTINAMAYNEEAGLVDLYGGMQDLQRKVVRCVGDPDERFDEDALRILRAVRFAAKLGFSIDPREAISRHKEHLRQVSAERIQTEVIKLLISPHPEMWKDVYDLGLSAVILPEFDLCMETPQNTPHHLYNVGDHTIQAMTAIPAEKVLRLTMLLHDLGKPKTRWTDSTGRDHFKGHAEVSAVMADGILRRWRFDNDTRRKVVNLIRWHDIRPKCTPSDVRRCMYTVGVDAFEDYLAVRWADDMAKSQYRIDDKREKLEKIYAIYRKVLADGDCLSLKQLKLTGADVAALGIEGKAIGELLEMALLAVLRDPRMNDRDLLLMYARERAKGRAEA